MAEPEVAAFPPPRDAAGETLDRNAAVRLFGTPDATEGSLNEPRLRVENGIEFNERWIYERPKNEASRPRRRLFYWQRYDLVAVMRLEQDGHLVPESAAELLGSS